MYLAIQITSITIGWAFIVIPGRRHRRNPKLGCGILTSDMEKILKILSGFIISITIALGYPGVILLMAIESACIPLPSEIIMPFAGALCSVTVAREYGINPLNLHGVAFCGALGCALGSAFAYWVGRIKGRAFFDKYGKYLLIRKSDLDRADKWFARWGAPATFFSRLLPIVRTFISLPAGISHMPFWPFFWLALFGSWPWCYLLAFLGMKMGDNWSTLRSRLHGFDMAIAVLLVLGFLFWLYHHLKPEKEAEEK